MDDEELTPGINAMISIQHLVFELLSLALAMIHLSRKVVVCSLVREWAGFKKYNNA